MTGRGEINDGCPVFQWRAEFSLNETVGLASTRSENAAAAPVDGRERVLRRRRELRGDRRMHDGAGWRWSRWLAVRCGAERCGGAVRCGRLTFWAGVQRTIAAFLPWLQGGSGGVSSPAGVQAKHVVGPCFGIGVEL